MANDFGPPTLSLQVRPKALAALRLHSSLLREGGRLIFLAGDAGSGRSATLDAFVRELDRRHPAPAVTAVRFERPDKVVPMPAKVRHRSTRILPIVGAAGATAAVAPVLAPALVGLAVLAQLAQAAGNAGAVMQQLALLRQHGAPSSPDLLVSALRIVAQRKPVVCVLDDFYRADPLWWRLLLRDAAPELAQLPVLLVAAVHPEAYNIDESLIGHTRIADGLGLERFTYRIDIDPVHANEPGWQVYGMAEPLRTDLVELAGGAAGAVEELWGELLRTGAVEQHRGRWRWAPGVEPKAAGAGVYLGTVRQLFDRRVRDRCKTPAQQDLAWAIVRMAAIEGRRFTPAAAVSALQAMEVEGFDDADEVLDFIDDVLGAGHGSARAIQVDERPLQWRAGGNRFAYQAAFINGGFAEALRRYGLSESERQRWAEALGHALMHTYAGAEPLVYQTLARVWAAAKDDQRVSWALRQQVGAYSGALVSLLMSGESVSAVDRLFYVGHALNAAEAVLYSRPREATALAKSALVAARAAGSLQASLLALHMVVDSLRVVNGYRDALPYASAAVDLAGPDNGNLYWHLRFQLASCHLGMAKICRKCTDHRSQAAALSGELLQEVTADTQEYRTALAFQASLLIEDNECDRALPIFHRVVALSREAGNLTMAQASIRQIGYCLIELRRYREAAEALEESHRLAVRLGDAAGVAKSLHELTVALLRAGQLPEARLHSLRALTAWEEVGAPQDAVCGQLHTLATIAGRYGDARLASALMQLRRLVLLPAEVRVALAAEDDAVAARLADVRDLAATVRRLHADSDSAGGEVS